MRGIRRTVALDLWGTSGRPFQRRCVLVGYVLMATAVPLLGVIGVVQAPGARALAESCWFTGVGLNVVPLAWHALALSRPGALAAELDGVDVSVRSAGRSYVWVCLPVPLLVLVLALVRREAAPER